MDFLTIFIFIAGASIASAQTSTSGPVNNALCIADSNLLQATLAINTTDLATAGPTGSSSLKCELGPAWKIFTVKNEFHFPPIYRGACEKLKCADPPCIARHIIWRFKCVFVFRLVNDHWVRVGFRIRRYPDHTACRCKTCEDIKDLYKCRLTRSCPNNNSTYSFCYLTVNKKCACCTPKLCPFGQIFNPLVCDCICPGGTRKEGDYCIGNCRHIHDAKYCNFVRCDYNPKVSCRYTKNGCECPSCDDAKTSSDCSKTLCLEQPNKPYCVYDDDKSKCRCPKCEDEKNSREKCLLISCGLKHCRFNPYDRSPCSCPHEQSTDLYRLDFKNELDDLIKHITQLKKIIS